MLLPCLLTACSDNDEPDGDMRGKHVIEFSQPFVNHASRAVGLSKDNLTEFTIYGYVHRPDSYIFEGETVRKQSDGQWICDRTEYWYPGQTYYFTGIAPVDSKSIQFTPALKGNGTMPGGGSITYNVSSSKGQEDLIYAFETVRMPDPLPEEYVKKVEMKFNHLLSKIEFAFYNDLVSPYYFINVNWLQIDNAYSVGTINKAVRNAKWEPDGAATTYIGVGAVPYIHTDKPSVSPPVYILPIYHGGMSVMIKTQVFEAKEPFGNEGFDITGEQTINVDFPPIDLMEGRAYKIICHLKPSNVEGDAGPLRPISFTIEEQPWQQDIDVETDRKSVV